jgi:hypothetical protein
MSNSNQYEAEEFREQARLALSEAERESAKLAYQLGPKCRAVKSWLGRAATAAEVC